MKLKIASYNISGGFFKEDNSKEFFDKSKAQNIDTRLLDETVKIINDEDIDIVCFQEIITTKEINYINRIKERTNLKYSEEYELSPCHIVENTDCGIAILSKYPITDSIKSVFTNPKLSKTTSSGNTYYTFDKGYLAVNINIDSNNFNILTHQGFPFRRFNSTPEDNKNVFIEFDTVINNLKPNVITGDFNCESYLDMMPTTRNNYIRTIFDTTIDDGDGSGVFDNILVLNNTNYNSKTIETLSDHDIVVAEINL